MKKYSSALLAAALILGIAAFVPAPAQAADWCMLCDVSPECFSCCMCEFNDTGYCGLLCGSPDSALETEAALTSEDEGEVLACTADEAPGTDEATSTN